MELQRSRLVAFVAVLWIATGAFASWTDNFDGGTFDLTWGFADEAGNSGAGLAGTPAAFNPSNPPNPPATYSAVTAAGYLDINSTTNAPGIPPTLIFGVVPEVFGDVRLSGQINVNNPGGFSNADIGLAARGDPATGSAYVMTLDLATGSVDITKAIGGVESASLAHFDSIDDPANTTLFFEFDVYGAGPVELVGRIFDADRTTLLAELSGQDTSDPLLSGVCGVVGVVNGNASIPSPIGATFDGVDAWNLPEPATLSLLAIGGLGALLRRRRR